MRLIILFCIIVGIENITQISRKPNNATFEVYKYQEAIKSGGEESNKCTLILTEGDSATDFVVSTVLATWHCLFICVFRKMLTFFLDIWIFWFWARLLWYINSPGQVAQCSNTKHYNI